MLFAPAMCIRNPTPAPPLKGRGKDSEVVQKVLGILDILETLDNSHYRGLEKVMRKSLTTPRPLRGGAGVGYKNMIATRKW